MVTLMTTKDSVEEKNTFINEEKAILTVEDAINGAVEIIAEWISDEANTVNNYVNLRIRTVSWNLSKEEELWREESLRNVLWLRRKPVKSIVPHRVLALNRARCSPRNDWSDVTNPLQRLKKRKSKLSSPSAPIEGAIEESYKRFIDQPSNAKSVMNSRKARKHKPSPSSRTWRTYYYKRQMKGQVILGLICAYRQDAKLSVIDETGKLGKFGDLSSRRAEAKRAQQADNSVASWNNTE